jgi:hypothetical protein
MVQVSAGSNICTAKEPSGRHVAWIQAGSALLLGLLVREQGFSARSANDLMH